MPACCGVKYRIASLLDDATTADVTFVVGNVSYHLPIPGKDLPRCRCADLNISLRKGPVSRWLAFRSLIPRERPKDELKLKRGQWPGNIPVYKPQGKSQPQPDSLPALVSTNNEPYPLRGLYTTIANF